MPHNFATRKIALQVSVIWLTADLNFSRHEEKIVIDATVVPAFIAASLVIILSPGADTMLLLRYAIKGGRPDGFRALVGILLGLSLVSILLVSGVGALIATISWAIPALTLVGAGVLLALGVISTTQGYTLLRVREPVTAAQDRLSATTLTSSRPLSAAFVTNATNPKVLIFYLAFFPQFLGVASSATWQLTFLAIVFLVITIMWLIPLVYAASAMRDFFSQRRVMVVAEFVAGAVFILLAVVLLIRWGA